MIDWKKAGPYLEVREGVRKTSYRVNFRQGGKSLRQVLRATDLKAAKKEAERLIYEAKFGPKTPPLALISCESIAEQLLKESLSQDLATQDIKRLIFKKHIIPWLNEHYPYGSQLTVETWPKYKLYKRGINPTIALENHHKYFRMLANRAWELRLFPSKLSIKFSVKKEEFREKGMIIPKREETYILSAANRIWRNRSIIQRDTGMRPGEVRNLRKDRVTWNGDGTVTLRLLEEDTKTHRYREFVVKSRRAVDALTEQRDYDEDSPYFFAMRTDHSRPMDKHQKGWKWALKRAHEQSMKDGNGPVGQDYTPHDWRHTYATDMFKRVGVQGSVALCYQLDMSLEMANAVYLHLDSKDTHQLAEIVASEAA